MNAVRRIQESTVNIDCQDAVCAFVRNIVW